MNPLNYPMKSCGVSCRSRLSAILCAVLGLATLLTIGAMSAHAQANLTFSGGSGAPVSFTLNAPVTYTITSTSAYPIFVIQGADSTGVDFGSYYDQGSLLTYSVNGVGDFSVSSVSSGYSYNDIGPSDIAISGYPYPYFRVGDIVTLNPHQTDTYDNVAVPAPASGDYTTFILDSNASVVSSTNGVSAAPEPGTWAMLALGGAAGLAAMYRRYRRATA